MKPAYVTALEQLFGEPSQSAFGSSVFFDAASEEADGLESVAKSRYRFFLGELWDRFGEQKWMSNWSQVYARDQGKAPDILAELRGLSDREARQSAGLLLENQEDEQASSAALKDAFDNPPIEELSVFKVGDGDAMSGVVIAARISGIGSLSLILLMD